MEQTYINNNIFLQSKVAELGMCSTCHGEQQVLTHTYNYLILNKYMLLTCRYTRNDMHPYRSEVTTYK